MSKTQLEAVIVNVARSADVHLLLKQKEKIATFLNLLAKWNERINLVSRKNFRTVVADRLFDALVLWREFRPWAGKSHLDIGSGGGFPAIPIHIMSPGEKLTLVEPRHRRASFLSTVTVQLDLDDVEIRRDRVEERIEDGGALGMFDFVTAQAVKPLKEMLPVVLTRLGPGGRFVWVAPNTIPDVARDTLHRFESRYEIMGIARVRPNDTTCWIGSIERVS